jgi:hypothetical protein
MNRTTMLEKMKKKGVKFDGAPHDSRATDGKVRARAERRSGADEVAEQDDPTEAGDSPDSQRPD